MPYALVTPQIIDTSLTSATTFSNETNGKILTRKAIRRQLFAFLSRALESKNNDPLFRTYVYYDKRRRSDMHDLYALIAQLVQTRATN